MDPEDVARKAMLGETLFVPAPPPVHIPPTTSSTVELPRESKFKAPAWLNATNAKKIVSSFWFRYVIVFVACIILLMVIKPPFVQLRRKNQSALEKAPTSYRRVMIAAAFTTGLVAILPFVYAHRSKFVSTASLVKKWF